MAHQLAELLRGIRQARSARGRHEAVSTATEVITRLWRHRSDFPDGWPPDAARRRMDSLTPRSNHWDPTPAPTGSAWVDRFRELSQLAMEEMQLWWKLALLETGVEDQRELLARIPEPARDEEEPEDIQWLRTELKLHDEAAAWASQHKARTRAAVRELAAEAFAEIAARRATLIAESVSARPYRRPRRHRNASTEK